MRVRRTGASEVSARQDSAARLSASAMSEGAKVTVGRGAIGKEVKHGGLALGVEGVAQRCEECLGPKLFLMGAQCQPV